MSKKLALGTIVLYALFAFVWYELNPEKWSIVSRLTWTMIWAMLYVVDAVNEADKKGEKGRRTGT